MNDGARSALAIAKSIGRWTTESLYWVRESMTAGQRWTSMLAFALALALLIWGSAGPRGVLPQQATTGAQGSVQTTPFLQLPSDLVTPTASLPALEPPLDIVPAQPPPSSASPEPTTAPTGSPPPPPPAAAPPPESSPTTTAPPSPPPCASPIVLPPPIGTVCAPVAG